MATPTTNMRSLDRALDVLGVLEVAKQPMRLSEVARSAGLHVATTQRIINVLVERGFAARTGEGYTAGPAALSVAHAFMVTHPLSVLAQQTLQQLAANTKYTASLYVRVEHSRVLIARVESAAPLSYVLPVGERLPLYTGSAGKTMLAELPPNEINAILAEAGPITLATGALISRAEIDAQLDKIRSDGYGVSISERLYGITSVVAPVRSADGLLAAVLGITGPAESFSEAQIAKVVPQIRRAATQLGERIPISS